MITIFVVLSQVYIIIGPYFVQVKLLRQIILSGMGDHVARYNATTLV